MASFKWDGGSTSCSTYLFFIWHQEWQWATPSLLSLKSPFSLCSFGATIEAFIICVSGTVSTLAPKSRQSWAMPSAPELFLFFIFFITFLTVSTVTVFNETEFWVPGIQMITVYYNPFHKSLFSSFKLLRFLNVTIFPEMTGYLALSVEQCFRTWQLSRITKSKHIQVSHDESAFLQNFNLKLIWLVNNWGKWSLIFKKKIKP